MSAPSKRTLPLLLGHKKTKAVKRARDKKVQLNLTSMIDMFTILVVFLLKSYSAEGQIITISEALTLPQASFSQKVEMKLEIQVSNEAIVVDGDPIVAVTPALLSTGNAIPALTTRLSDHMEYNRRMRGTITEEDMKINIQGDVAIPAILLQRVMASCSEAGFSLQNLEVIESEGEER